MQAKRDFDVGITTFYSCQTAGKQALGLRSDGGMLFFPLNHIVDIGREGSADGLVGRGGKQL